MKCQVSNIVNNIILFSIIKLYCFIIGLEIFNASYNILTFEHSLSFEPFFGG